MPLLPSARVLDGVIHIIMKTHLQRYITEISTEIERTEKLEAALAQKEMRLGVLEHSINAMVQSMKNSAVYTDIEAECAGLRKELEDAQMALEAQALKSSKASPNGTWEITAKLPDGRIGRYVITEWPNHINASEVFRSDICLSLNRIN